MDEENAQKPLDPEEVAKDPDAMSRPVVQQGISEQVDQADASMPEGRGPGTPTSSGANFTEGTTQAAEGSETGDPKVQAAMQELGSTGKAGEATKAAEQGEEK